VLNKISINVVCSDNQKTLCINDTFIIIAIESDTEQSNKPLHCRVCQAFVSNRAYIYMHTAQSVAFLPRQCPC